MTMRTAPPKSVDEYLAPLPGATRDTLDAMRKVIKAAYPDAVEGISYGLPYYRYRGRMLIAMGAAKNHCSLHGVVFGAVGDEFKKYETTKGAIHIPIGKPPTAAFIKKLLKARIEQDEKNAAKNAAMKKAEKSANAASKRREASMGMTTRSTATKTVDDFLAVLPEDARSTLEKLRKTIRSVVPEAEEVVSYGVPAYRYEGRMLVSIGATKDHCAFYVQSPAVMEALKEDLAGYATGKGTVRFPIGQSLPGTLVRQLINARVEENRKLAKK